MLLLNLPSFEPKIVIQNGKQTIFDPLRRKYIVLTPEEWVRQHFISFLIQHKGYPKGLLANEIELILNGTKRRCDTVLY
ncbi:MAG: type I restriction enzyme HsdR N-terminal domain-containing protein, partial [Phocaeicola sp.]